MSLSCRIGAVLGFILCLFLTTAGATEDAMVVRRAAFDIGSAAIKCTVADVDTTTGTIIKVVKDFSHKVDFAEDMARSYDGNFSKEVMTKGMAVLKELKQEALKLHATGFSAVGGAAFRSARNGRAYFATIKDELGISARVISKQQASLLSYHSVGQDKTIPQGTILVWDIGGGNQQMTARNLDGSLAFYIDNLASVSFKNVVIEVIQKKDINTVKTPNPVSANEVQRALEYVQTYAQMNVPPPLTNRIKSGTMNVIGIGGVHYYGIPALLGERESSYTRDQVQAALEKWTGKTDEEFDDQYANTRLTNLILVLGYMNALDIDTVSPLKVNQTEGLLVAPEFW